MFKYLMICLETHCLNASKLLPTPSWEKKNKTAELAQRENNASFHKRARE